MISFVSHQAYSWTFLAQEVGSSFSHSEDSKADFSRRGTMPSMQDLPNEVLSRIAFEKPELWSLVLVNCHFYAVHIRDLYENFTYDSEDAEDVSESQNAVQLGQFSPPSSVLHVLRALSRTSN